MNFEAYKPCPALADAVICYWGLHTKPDEQPHTERVYSTGGIPLIFHYGTPFIEHKTDGSTASQRRFFLCGQSISFCDVTALPGSGMIGVVLYPHALRNFSSVPMNQLSGIDVAIADFFPGCADLEDRLCAARCDAERVTILDQTFLALRRPDAGRHYRTVNEALRIIEHSRALVSEQDVLGELEMNERALQRIFADYIGLSPHEFIRLRRVNHAIDAITSASRLTDLAYDSNFYDQSHFIKSFKSVTGYTPGEFRRRVCRA